jgi:hypothetical protein
MNLEHIFKLDFFDEVKLFELNNIMDSQEKMFRNYTKLFYIYTKIVLNSRRIMLHLKNI